MGKKKSKSKSKKLARANGKATRRDVLAGAAVAAGAVAIASTAKAQDATLVEASTTPVSSKGGTLVDGASCSAGWEHWVESAVKATLSAWDKTLAESEYVDGVINGPIIEGLKVEMVKGSVEEKLLPALIEVGVPKAIARPWAKAAEKAWYEQWRRWTLPATAAFPSFAAVAAPEAPPTEALPMPLKPHVSNGWSGLSAQALFADLAERLGDLLHIPGLPDAVKAWAKGASAPMERFAAEATLSGIMGKGPVPSFAPPYVPVGPVVMGDNLPMPGHMMALGFVTPTLTNIAAELEGKLSDVSDVSDVSDDEEP